jgi:lysophospholipase L1-like esterase
MDFSGKKINFLGDSITEGVGTSDIKYVYWKRFEENDGCIVRGYGISGTRIARQQKPVPDDPNAYFGSRVESMDPDADIVVVFGGTNDYGHGDAAIGKMSDRTDDTFYGAMHKLCVDLINKYPKAQIVIMTPCHRLNEERVYNEYGARNVATLREYADIIREVAEFYGLPVCDLYRNGGMNPQNECIKNIYMPDGLHPSDAGNEVIYNRLRGLLESL